MKTIIILPLGDIQSQTSITLAIIYALRNQGLKVGFTKPISQYDDRTIEEVKTYFNFTPPPAITQERLTELINHNQYDEILEEVMAKTEEASRDNDIVVIEGLHPSANNLYFSRLNIAMVKALNAGIILAGNAGNDSAEKLGHCLDLFAHIYKQPNSWFAGYFFNRIVQPIKVEEIYNASETEEARSLKNLGMIPEREDLADREAFFHHIAENISLIPLIEKLQDHSPQALTPSAFRYQLIRAAQKECKRIVLPEGEEPRTLKAALMCVERKIAYPILLGNPDTIQEVARKEGLTLPKEGYEILSPKALQNHYFEAYIRLRQKKGRDVTKESAKEALKSSVVLGTVMLAENDVDGLVAGALHTTAEVIRPALQLIGTSPQSSLVSSIFFMLMPDQVHIYGDCAINPTPTPEQLADIALQSAHSAQAFGIDPKVALISYSTGSSGSGPAIEVVKKATLIAKEKAPHLAIDGPLQFDAAYVPSVGRQKAPESKVAGQANVYIFPDLNTGNTTYKAVQRSANVISIGPMLQGLAKPVNDLSRGALVDDIVYTIAITAIQAIAQ